jgi:hypothetical protein
MTPEQALAFVLFSVAAAGPPGPGHAMLTAVGANVGVLRGLPALLGVALGMGLMMSLRARQPDPRPPRCPAGAQVVRGRIPLLARLEDRDGGRSRRGRRRPAGRDPRRGRVSVDQPEVVARVRQRSGDLPGGGDGERRQPVGRLRARVRGGVAAPAASPGWPSGPVLQRVLRAERPRASSTSRWGAPGRVGPVIIAHPARIRPLPSTSVGLMKASLRRSVLTLIIARGDPRADAGGAGRGDGRDPLLPGWRTKPALGPRERCLLDSPVAVDDLELAKDESPDLSLAQADRGHGPPRRLAGSAPARTVPASSGRPGAPQRSCRGGCGRPPLSSGHGTCPPPRHLR